MVEDAPALAGLRRVNLRVQAREALRRAITTGELPAGELVSEVVLAQQLSISRGTLREALRQLQQEGLLTEAPRGRLQVRTMDESELRDVFAVRAALEGLAARTIGALPERSAILRRLEERVAAMEQATASSLDDRIEADLSFHRSLCRLSGNITLTRSWEQLEGSIRMSFMYAGLERAVANMVVDRHRELLSAIGTGDPEAAEQAVRDHMESAADTLVA